MTPEDLAALHARCFDNPRPWSADEFASLLAGRGTFLLEAPHGFLMGRAIAGEAELLTVAVDPQARRAGTGRALVAAFAGKAAALEVAHDNLAARRLYQATGWLEAGVRRRYYGPATDAIVMRLTLRATQEGG